MATKAQKSNPTQQQVTLPIVIVAALIAIVFLIGMFRHYEYAPGQSPSDYAAALAPKTPVPDWVVQDAVSCKGDITKLGPDEQRKIYSAYPGMGAKAVIAATYATHS